MQGIAAIVQQNRMNQVANQILNTQNAPRAALAGQGTVPSSVWNNPATWAQIRQNNLGITGTAPATGGTLELAMQNEQAQENLKAQQQQLANALKMAQIQNYLSLTQRRAGLGAGQLTPAQQLAEQHRLAQQENQNQARAIAYAQKQQQAGIDTPEKVLKDFNSTYPGKIADPGGDVDAQGNPLRVSQGEAFYNALSQGLGGRGNIVNGQFVGDPNGDYYTPIGGQTVPGQTMDDPNAPRGIFGGAPQIPKIASAQGLPASQVPKIKWADLQPYMTRLDQIKAGGGRYTPALRAQPVTGPSAVAQAAPTGQTTDTSGLPPGASGPLPDTTQSAAAPSLPSPQTQSDYDAIPSGSQFVDTDGITKTKF